MRSIGISYSRFSDPKQAKGDSQDRQDRMYRDFCQRHDLTPLKDVYADRGRSGYRDEHRTKGRFGQLVADAKDGRFEPGTVVVVEAWDRLGRLRPDKQTDLIAELLRTGVRIGICRLDDIFKEEDFGTHKWTTLAVFIQLAYQESKQKAERISASWQKRRERARDEGALMTRRLPAWLEEVKGRTAPIPEHVAALRRIFSLSADGYGRTRIIRTLEAEGVQPFGDSQNWTRPYVNKLLNDRRVLGEYQPRLTDDTPDGPVIHGYYPQVISDEEYLLARRGQEGRCGPRGPKGSRGGTKDSRYVNVFQSILFHARDRGSYFLSNRGTGKKPVLILVSSAGASGNAERTYTFPYPVFETALLSQLWEVDPKDVVPRERNAGLSRADELRARLQKVREEIRQLQADLKEGYSKGLAAVLREQEALEEQTAGELQEELSRSLKPAEKAWREFRQLVQLVKEGGDPVRLKLRAELRQAVDSIWMVTHRTGRSILATVQVWFKAGGYRSYLLIYRQAGNHCPARWYSISIIKLEAASPRLKTARDLRKRADAARALKDLETFPTDLLDKLLEEDGEPLP
jgi:DNA invertase Pin-like site-specific DNA recombinase